MPAEVVAGTHALVVPDLRSILPVDAFAYSVPTNLAESVLPGHRVEVPFGNRTVM